MIQICFSFNSPEEVTAFLANTYSNKTVSVPQENKPAEPKTEIPAKAKPGRKKKESTVEEIKAAAPKETATEPGVKLTQDDCREALQLVVKKHSLAHATELMKKLGYARITAIPENKFGDFISACKTEAGA